MTIAQIIFKEHRGRKSSIAADISGAWPDRLPSVGAATRFLSGILFPRSGRWVYQLNGKSGTTFALGLLFQLEFGSRFSAHAVSTANQHPEIALFHIVKAGLLSNVMKEAMSLAQFSAMSGLRLATVRNPYSRSVSSFRYLCRSHQFGDLRLLTERVRLNAVVGFDWIKDPYSLKGFHKFLQYVLEVKTHLPMEELDAHWLPQAWHIQPGIYQPDIVGRTEDLPTFAASVCEALGCKAIDLRSISRNASNDLDKVATDWYGSRRLAQLVQKIYEEDFDTFQYPRKV